MEDYIEQFADYFYSSDAELELEYDINKPSLPEFSGCTLLTEGPTYDSHCKDDDDIDSSKPCLVYSCPKGNMTDNIWKQRKSAISQYYKNSCDDKKIFAGPSMILNEQRLYHGFCSKNKIDIINDGLIP
jgi:hypothetical protein